jgi:hypothetical protein
MIRKIARSQVQYSFSLQLDVKSLAKRPQACFVESFTKRWMGVNGAADVFQSGTHLDRQAECAGQLRYAGANRGDAKNEVVVSTRRHADVDQRRKTKMSTCSVVPSLPGGKLVLKISVL